MSHLRDFALATFLLACLSHPASAQKAVDALDTGEPGYKLGCVVAVANCSDVCDELWSEKQKAERTRRCENEKLEKRKQIQDCQQFAFKKNGERQKVCTQLRGDWGPCLRQSSKQLEDDLARCG